MSGHTALSQSASACRFLKEADVGPVTIGSTPYGASGKATSAAVCGKAGPSRWRVPVECATPAASRTANAEVAIVVRDILENAMVMSVNFSGAESIRLG